MRKLLGILTLIAAILIAPSIVQPRLGAQGYSGALPVVSAASGTSLRAKYTSGKVSQGGAQNTITADATGLLTTASMNDCAAPTFTACNIIYWPGSGSALATTTSVSTAFKPGNIVVAYVTTSSNDILVVTPSSWSPGIPDVTETDRFVFVSPGACSFTTGGSVAAASGWPKWVQAAASSPVYEFKTDTAAGTVTAECQIRLPESRSTSGTGMTVTGVDVLYGIVAWQVSTMTDPTFSTVTFPATGGANAAGTVASAGGSLTLLPVSGAWQTTNATSGLMYRGRATFGTPVAINSPNQSMTIRIQFGIAGTVATQIDLAGFAVFFKGAQ